MTALTIDRLALRCQSTPTGRRRALSRLERIDPAEPGAPAEILILRRMADPAPGMLSRPPGRSGAVLWERALAAQLARLRAVAVWPGRGDADAGAEAVLFADEVELRACLAERLAAGLVPGWWAQVPLRGLALDGSPAALLAQRPHLLPAIFSALVIRRTAAAVLTALHPAKIAALARVLGLSSPPDPVRPPTVPQLTLPDSSDTATQTAQVLAKAAPAVLAAALVQLADAPARLLAAGWLRWHRPALSGAALDRAAATLVRLLAERPKARSQPEAESIGTARHRRPDPASPPEAILPGSESVAGAEQPRSWPETTLDAAQRPKPATWQEDATMHVDADEYAAPQLLPAAPDHPETQEARAERAAERSATAQQVATLLGGVLFLINLWTGAIPRRAVALTAALTAAERPQDGPWAALERLARALLRPRSETTEDTDPIWCLCADMDGRLPQTVPPRAPDPAIVLQPADLAAAQAVQSWIAAAGWGPDPPEDASAVADLLRRPARIFVTPARLDAVFPVDAATLPARRAGLDLDPGWQPRFGRSIAFHYRD